MFLTVICIGSLFHKQLIYNTIAKTAKTAAMWIWSNDSNLFSSRREIGIELLFIWPLWRTEHAASSVLTVTGNKDKITCLHRVWYFLLRLWKYLFACISFLKSVVGWENHMVISTWILFANSSNETGDSEARSGSAALYIATLLLSSLL